LDDRLRKATIERLLPCIIDSQPVPRDLELSTTRRAVNRVGLENWEWEKCLGIACALFRGNHIEKGYKMALEPDRVSRDYLYGRLLAIADNIENYALSLAGEKRDTTAARLMQRPQSFNVRISRVMRSCRENFCLDITARDRSGGGLRSHRKMPV
jgi:CRISPR-associated protein Csd1